MPRLCISALTELIRLHAVRGRAETAATLLLRLNGVLADATGSANGVLGGLLELQQSMAGAHAAVARRDWGRLLQLLDTAGPLADRLRRGREGIEIKLLRAMALRASGMPAEALMAEALSLATAYGLRRLCTDTYPEIAEWAGQLGRSTDGRATTRAEGVSGGDRARRNSEQTPPLPSVSPSALLTPKEREVLELLARRLSNKQIAAALDVGDATIKWHLKNLFAKLAAGTREHALQRARMLGILGGI
jgi:LuxR family maltose regulon positive regulatory protein